VRRFEDAFLRQASAARTAAEASYRNGASSPLEFLEAQRAYIQTQRDHLDAVRAAHEAAYDVMRAGALDTEP
jgi:outer membrane protein TolC